MGVPSIWRRIYIIFKEEREVKELHFNPLTLKKRTHPISSCGGSLADEGEVSIDKTEKPYINPDFTSGRSLPACTYFDDKSAPLDIAERAQ